MHIASIGIDLGKTTFHLVALGERARFWFARSFSRTQLLAYTTNLPTSLMGLEACSGAHFLAAAHENKVTKCGSIPAQFVKPYRKSNKNDFIDAEAIAEAVTKQNMRFVAIKSEEQLDVQAMHRVRDRLVQRRTALINEIRGFLLERGITFPTQPIHLRNCFNTLEVRHSVYCLLKCSGLRNFPDVSIFYLRKGAALTPDDVNDIGNAPDTLSEDFAREGCRIDFWVAFLVWFDPVKSAYRYRQRVIRVG